jgi:hypothetical protein
LLSGIATVRGLGVLMALGPLVFYMLQELGVPGAVQLVAVFPVDDEFRE